ncbi:MAG TPA: Gfo/Idh/MocA family oxidoreductase [Tepidisphaeraceae bacterium]|jgi:predicted dehydrogenase
MPETKASTPAPTLPYEPATPTYNPPIALIGCGWVTEYHLKAYQHANLNIVAFCDCNQQRALDRQKNFYPSAKVYTDHHELLQRDDIEVVDIATHPAERVGLIEDALRAGKHVLSQKPFVLDLDTGERLVDLADKVNRKLAVNQNGRWAPHFSYLRHLVAQGHLGEMMAAHLTASWDHNWTAGTPFDNIRHLLLYDFAIHWFDIVTQFIPNQKPQQVFAAIRHAPQQRSKPALLGQVMIEFSHALATLALDGSTPIGPWDTTYLAGTAGSARSEGPDLNAQTITLTAKDGIATPKLEGSWFREGFQGTMAELLSSIEENRTPNNNARDNLTSLALCFAAIASAETGEPQTPGAIRKPPL